MILIEMINTIMKNIKTGTGQRFDEILTNGISLNKTIMYARYSAAKTTMNDFNQKGKQKIV